MIVCDCTDHHSASCRLLPLVQRYDELWLRAQRRYQRRWNSCHGEDEDCHLTDEARRLLDRIATLWDVASSPEVLRRLVRDLEARQETRR
jgi:hypothetical protein